MCFHAHALNLRFSPPPPNNPNKTQTPTPTPTNNENHQNQKQDYDAATYVGPMHAALLPRLEASDIDQEIKECAITAVGKLVTHLGTYVRVCIYVCVYVHVGGANEEHAHVTNHRHPTPSPQPPKHQTTHITNPPTPHPLPSTHPPKPTQTHQKKHKHTRITGDRLPPAQLDGVLRLLMDKLRNEITRTPALRALAAIATSPLRIDLSAWACLPHFI